jgi:hypothetical protein
VKASPLDELKSRCCIRILLAYCSGVLKMEWCSWRLRHRPLSCNSGALCSARWWIGYIPRDMARLTSTPVLHVCCDHEVMCTSVPDILLEEASANDISTILIPVLHVFLDEACFRTNRHPCHYTLVDRSATCTSCRSTLKPP